MRRFHRSLPAFLLFLASSSFFVFPQSQLQVGYAHLSVASGTNRPSGTALFTYSSSDGTILWQAGVGAVEPIRSGRIFVDRTSGTRTAIALANPSNQPVAVKLVLRDAKGSVVGSDTPTLKAYEHVPRFVEELIAGIPQSLTVGTLSFETVNSDQRLAAITLRETRNARDEPLYATLPVADMDAAATKVSLTFPQVALGGGYKTQIILISRSSQQVKGKIRLFQSDGAPFQLPGGSEIAYQIEANGAYRLEMSNEGAVQVGYATVSLDQGDTIPSGTLIFQMMKNGKPMTEAGVGAIPATTKARIFIDRAGTETGIALASPGNGAASVTLNWMDRQGRGLGTTKVDLPAGGHTAKFAYELNPGLPPGFTGVLELTAPVPIVPITLMLTTNPRDDFILTTMPVADLTRATGDKSVVFPQIAFGSGYETRLILINTEITKNEAVDLSFYQSNGTPLTVALGGTSNSKFTVSLVQGGGSQLRPGNSATPKEIITDLADPVGTEVTVNAGSSVYLNPVTVDSAGRTRDDFWFVYVSTDPETASVDAQGKLSGRAAGFSTLVIASGSLVKVLTVCVVGVNSGVGGYIIPGTVGGVAQDRANRIYTASATDQTVWLGKSATTTPERYAGVSQNAGLKNDLRLQSLFRNPTFLAVDELNKVLYVSDAGNSLIRRVYGGDSGKVDTLTSDKAWSNPQGLALDTAGYLWVCDSGSHTVRRVSLKDGKVTIVAGSVGQSGFADGLGDKARFNSPVGIALEAESASQQLEREIAGTPPPPLSVIVADSGNNQLRRVTADGTVTTIGSLALTGSAAAPGIQQGMSNTQFSGPVGVALDAAGNIFVSEPAKNSVKLVLASTGRVVQAVQSGSISSPRGMAAAEYGHMVVGTGLGTAQEIFYGPPAITSVTPVTVSSQGGIKVTIKGKNFSQETVATLGNSYIDGLEVLDTQTLSFISPPVPSGLSILSVQNRGGLAQQPVRVQPKQLSDIPTGTITTVAGGSTYSGEGSLAASACIGDPKSLAFDSRGNMYFASYLNHRVFRVDRLTGILATVAGTGVQGEFFGENGDGAFATTARLTYPDSLAFDKAGNLFIAELDRVRIVDTRTGLIYTAAGGGWEDQDGLPAQMVGLSPAGIWADGSGNLWIATADHRIRKVDISGIITTIAGTGAEGFGGDGGPAKGAVLNGPTSILGDNAGNLYIADTGNQRIRKIDSTGMISTIAGTGKCEFSGDGGQASKASLCEPYQLSFDAAGNLYFADSWNSRIRRISTAGIISTIAGKGDGFSGDGGPATDATLLFPEAVAVDSAGQVFIGDRFNSRVRLVDLAGRISTIAGNGEFRRWNDGDAAWASAFFYPYGIAADADGSYYVTDIGGYARIRKVDGKTGIISTVAGAGNKSDDNIPATEASLTVPTAVAADSAGNLFIADNYVYSAANDAYLFLIRRVDAATRKITTIAGRGGSGSDNIPAANAVLDEIGGIAVDAKDNLYITQPNLNQVRKIDRATGLIGTFAGNGDQGFSGDGGPAAGAAFSYPVAVAADRNGNLYIADEFNDRVRRVDAKGIITTVAGNGEWDSFPWVGGPATQLSLTQPESLAVDAGGNIFIGDRQHRVMRVDAASGILSSAAGDWYLGRQGYDGDGGPAADAALGVPQGLAFDRSGNLLLSDDFTDRIRAVKGPFPASLYAAQTCDLYSDGFASGSTSGWKFSSGNANWQVTGGKLQVSGISGGQTATAEHSLRGLTYFQLNLKVDSESLGSGGFGFMISQSNQALTFIDGSGAELSVGGIGIWVAEEAKFGLLIHDTKTNRNLVFNAASHEAVTSVGLRVRNDRIVLLVNGIERLAYPAEFFGTNSLEQGVDYTVQLLASGSNAKVRFSGICQKSIQSFYPE
jgi:sugar lactone lactonase YvrE